METTNQATVKIVRMGRDEVIVNIEDAITTVEQAFSSAGMDFNTIDRDVYCDGIKAEGSYKVNDGDVLSIVADSVKAGM
jgi:tRNA G37 N-methylase Trm5